MKVERTNVEFPLWRKKVDSSLFFYKETVIPKWVRRVWNLDQLFTGLKEKKKRVSDISIHFNKKQYRGQVRLTRHKKRTDPVYRLSFGDELNTELKEVFLMSFMRDIEKRLRPKKSSKIEIDIPFWEFLDIEFDGESKTAHMTAYYTQVPTFPALFRRLTYSPVLKRIDDELSAKKSSRIHKQDWRPRKELEAEIGAENAIYMLIDTREKLLYIGEAKRLVKRLQDKHPTIENWNFYRYDVLPQALEKFRVDLERMVIRNFATVLPNKRDIKSMPISDFRLANDKIDL